MSAGVYNFTLEQGASLRTKATLKDIDDNGVDLTGFTFSGHIRKNFLDQIKVAQFTFEIADQGTDTGSFYFILTPAQTAAIPNTNDTEFPYYYDIEMTTGVDQVKRILSGVVTLSPQVTR